MDLDKYIKLVEKMVVSAEGYVKASFEFEEYRNSLSMEELELMVAKSSDKYNYICELANRLEEAEERF